MIIIQALSLCETVSDKPSPTTDLKPLNGAINVLNYQAQNHPIYFTHNSDGEKGLRYEIKMMSHLLQLFPKVRSGLVSYNDDSLWHVYPSPKQEGEYQVCDVSNKYPDLKGSYKWTGAVNYLLLQTKVKDKVWLVGYDFWELVASELQISFMASDIFIGWQNFNASCEPVNPNPYRV